MHNVDMQTIKQLEQGFSQGVNPNLTLYDSGVCIDDLEVQARVGALTKP